MTAPGMWRQKSILFRQVLLVVDVAISALAFVIALKVRVYLGEHGHSWDLPSGLSWLSRVRPVVAVERYNMVMVGLLPLWGAALHFGRTADFRAGYRDLAVRYARAVLIGLALFVTASFLFKLEFVARTFVLGFGVLQFAVLLLARIGLMETVRAFRRTQNDGHRVLIVGCGDKAVSFAKSLNRQSPWNIKLLGYLTVPDGECDPAAKPVVGDIGGLAELLDTQPVDEVVFAVAGRPEVLADAMAACDERGVDVLLTLPPAFPSKGTMEIANVSGFDWPLLGMRRTPTAEFQLALKRLVDITGGMIGLLLAAPVIITVAILIRMDSKGPILFRQVRAGKHGRKFTMYKFRSMVVDAEEKRAALAHLNEMDGPVFKIQKDPRITKIGRFIRKTSIDELPQLFNIVLGEMSIVGPRPPLPSEVEQYKPWQRRRLSVKPGLTGLWQVSGRNQVDFDEWMQLDLEYIDNWSLWLDIKIIVRTVPVVLSRSGAS